MANHRKAVNGRRVCTICKIEKDESEFAPRAGKGENYGRYRTSQCRPCENARNKDRDTQRIERLNAIKAAAGCADCGFNDPRALDFDHLPQFEKSFNISTKVRRAPWDRILDEIAKCEVVCANCHRIRTWERINAESRV